MMNLKWLVSFNSSFIIHHSSFNPMRFRSTRSAQPTLGLSEAITSSLAPDGGLYVPESFPEFALEEFDGLERWRDVGERLLRPFFEGDPLGAHLAEICGEAFDFPLPLRELD